MRIFPGNAQDIGARTDQQDAFGFSDPERRGFASHGGVAAVVADGMGGLAHGAKASRAAVHTFLVAYEAKTASESIPDALQRALFEANRAVCSLAAGADMKSGVGTTLAAAVVHDSHLYWISVGDSRVYLCHEGKAMRLTSDHVFGNDLNESLAKGRISRAEALNHPGREDLTSYLGVPEIPLIDASTKPVSINPDDSVVLCTDGLYRALSEGEIGASLHGDPHRSCELLMQRALSKRQAHQDNITVVALKQMGGAGLAQSTRRALALTMAGFALLAVAAAAWWFFPPKVTVPSDRIAVLPGKVVQLAWTVSPGARVTIDPPACKEPLRPTGCELKPDAGAGSYTITASRLGRSVERIVQVEDPRTGGPKSRESSNGSGRSAAGDPKEGATRKPKKDQARTNENNDTTTSETSLVPLPVGKSPVSPTLGAPQEQPGKVEKQVVVNGRNVPVPAASDTKTAPNAGTPPAAPQNPLPPTAPSPNSAVGLAIPASPKVLAGVSAPKPVPPTRRSASIIKFEPDPRVLVAGQTAKLIFEIGGARYIKIRDGSGNPLWDSPDNPESAPVPRSIYVSPQTSTTYALEAIGEDGKPAPGSASIEVRSGPIKITRFEARYQAGAVHLIWNVTGAATSISIEPQVGPVAMSDDHIVSPKKETTYTLTAEGPKSLPEKRRVTAKVPEITFDPDRDKIERGDSVRLTWDARNATSFVLKAESGYLTQQKTFGQLSSGCIDKPTVDTTYTLTASGDLGTATASKKVLVASPASIGTTQGNRWRRFGSRLTDPGACRPAQR